MKKQIILKSIFLLIVLALVGGCREITVTTKVNSDGSIERTVAIRGDSTEVLGSRFPTPRDTTWTIIREKEDEGDKKHVYRAAKSFENFTEMNAFFDKQDTTRELRSSVNLKRRFRWFISFLRYEEVYRAYNPFKHIALTDYLTGEEIDILFSDDDNDEVSEKYQEWSQVNMLEEFMLQFIPLAEERTTLDSSTIRSKQSQIYEEFFNKSGDEDGTEQIIAALEKVYGVPLSSLRTEIKPLVDEIERKVMFIMDADGDSYSNIVEMPGLIMDTNAGQVEGNQVSWDISPKQFIDMDYTMWVESRVVNRWIIIITALLIVAPAGYSIYTAVKK